VGDHQRRRLVINIWGAKIWVTNIGGGKNLGKIYFQTTFSKKFRKTSFYSKKFLTTFFSHRQLFPKMYTLHSKFTPFSLYFSFFVFVSAFFHFFCKRKKKNSCLIIGGEKRGFAPS